jgi:hypothetical protein
MGQRMIRDWTDSYLIDNLSAEAERLFIRLTMKADDYGRYHANPKLLKAALFPLKEEISVEDIVKWLSECAYKWEKDKLPLLTIYEYQSKKYLVINNFGQRLRAMNSKFPPPADNVLTHDSQPSAEEKRREEEEKKKRSEGNNKFTPPALSEVISYFKEEGYSESAAKKAFKYYQTANWHDAKGNPVTNWKQKMVANWFKDQDKLTSYTSGELNNDSNGYTVKKALDLCVKNKEKQKCKDLIHKYFRKVFKILPRKQVELLAGKPYTEITVGESENVVLKYYEL